MMTQAYLDSQLQRKKYQINAIAEALEAIDNIPFIFNSNNNTTEITSQLFNFSNVLILPIVEKSIQLLKNHSNHLENKTIKQVGNAFIFDLKTIVQNFEKDLVDLTKEASATNENLEENHKNQGQQSASIPDTEKQINSETNQEQTLSSEDEETDYTLEKLEMNVKGNKPLKIRIQKPKPRNTTNNLGQNITLNEDLHLSESSNDSATKKQKLSITKNNLGETPQPQEYECPIPYCPKNYANWSSWGKHVRKHTGLETSCPINDCSNKIFTNQSELFEHLKCYHVLNKQK